MGEPPIEIHVIADSTGDTAARVARAVAAQFESVATAIVRHPRISGREGLSRVFERLSDCESRRVVVFSTLVDDGLRDAVAQHCAALGIEHSDLLGPAIAAVEKASGAAAERVPARPVGVDTNYFKRIAAMEYVIRHDDGAHPEGLAEADIVLVGVSRTGKTPLAMYLGYLGYKTANVPLVPGIPPPPQLFDLDRFRVIALTIDPKRLADIRFRRVTSIGAGNQAGEYARLTAIFEELDQAAHVQRRLGCPVIDTTNLALEEAAGRVIDLASERRKTPLSS